jgi:hypothetical protein
MIRSAIEHLEELGAEDQAQLLFTVNPARLLAGEDPLPIVPFPARRTLWSRLRTVFR